VDDFSADFPLLTADPRRLRQVLRNILDNAVKYSPGGGLIVIRGEVRPADVVISVADQGVGIAPEDLIPLFDKYFRVKSAAAGHVPGTGLGLPVTRAIVEAHGGRIWAESKLGHGTTFYFSLPRDDRAPLESDWTRPGQADV
jgi:two-component system sensor histidine kinase VicK